MEYILSSQELVGYKVKIWPREAFVIRGFTLVVPEDPEGTRCVNEFWRAVRGDGRMEKLVGASAIRPWVLGLGSWDPDCPKKGWRYTIAIEETGQTDFSALAKEYGLYRYELGASDWMCFQLTEQELHERLWLDDPYRMMKKLGYKFNGKVGVHFDAYPPDYDAQTNPNVEFWISVVTR